MQSLFNSRPKSLRCNFCIYINQRYWPIVFDELTILILFLYQYNHCLKILCFESASGARNNKTVCVHHKIKRFRLSLKYLEP